jgi:hypothetical protein
MTSISKYVYERYIDTLEEAHRRRPTRLSGPSYGRHLGIYYPRDIRLLESFFQAIFEALNIDSPETHSKNLASVYTGTMAVNEIESFSLSAAHVYETQCGAHLGNSRCRLEVHREYISISLFIPLNLQYRQINEIFHLDCKIDGCGDYQILENTKNEAYSTTIFSYFYHTLQDASSRFFDDIATKLDIWHNQEDISKNEKLRCKVFADLGGAIVPWEIFSPACPKVTVTGAITPKYK